MFVKIVVKVVGVICLVVVVCVVIIGIILKRKSVGGGSGVNGVVSEDDVYDWLLFTLSAFKNSIAARYRELHKEHELIWRNKRYHRTKIRDLIRMNLLRRETHLLHYAPKWQPHIAERRELDKMLREIHHVLCVWYIPSKYVIALAGHKARIMLERVVKELKDLKKLGEHETNLDKKS